MKKQDLHHLTGLAADLRFLDKATLKLPGPKKFTVVLSQKECCALMYGINMLLENYNESCAEIGKTNCRHLKNVRAALTKLAKER